MQGKKRRRRDERRGKGEVCFIGFVDGLDPNCFFAVVFTLIGIQEIRGLLRVNIIIIITV